jgi:hypothetical protein
LNIGVIELGSTKEKDLRWRDREIEEKLRNLDKTRTRESCDLLEAKSEDKVYIKLDDDNSRLDDNNSRLDDNNSRLDDDDRAIKERLIKLQAQAEDEADSDFEDEGSDFSKSSEDTESIESNDSDLHLGSSEIGDVPLRPRTPEPESMEEIDSDSWSQASELSLDDEEIRGLVNHGDDDGQPSYDPRLLRLEYLMWLNRSRVLALNQDSDPKPYISGRGRYDGGGRFYVQKPGRDPNDLGKTYLAVTAYAEEETMAFPFHEACFDILAKQVGLEKGREINKDVMWEALNFQVVDERSMLDGVDYKLSEGHDQQSWTNVPGEEYLVCDPSPRPGLREEIHDMLPACVLGRTSKVTDLSERVRSDPTQVLPYDILLGIIERMDTEDMLSFMKASYHVNSYTRESAFWKHMIRMRILPWFDELRQFIETTSTDALDYKGLFLWVDAVTRPKYGNQGPLMHIANRRRIWGCCQPLASLYKLKMGPVEPAEPEDSEEAKAILQSSVCLQMPMTMYP